MSAFSSNDRGESGMLMRSKKQLFRRLSVYLGWIVLCGVLFLLLLAATATGHATAAEKTMWVYIPAAERSDGVYVDDLLKSVMAERNIKNPPMAGEFPKGLRVEMIRAEDPWQAVNELFYRRGWTDGLPIVPPTEDRVRAMLKGTDRPPDDVVGYLEPMKGKATVEKIAVNAVMAGCRPEYLPIIIAAVDALCDPALNMLGVQTTTNPDTPLVIVNGPIAQQVGMNAGTNCLGPGSQANATIGRAIRLILNNIGGGWPGVSDMSAIGWPGKYTLCLPENEAANPWEPLHVELGFKRDGNVVTVVAAEGMQNILSINRNSEAFLEAVSDHLSGLDRAYRKVVVLMLATDTARMLARDGYTKDSIREFIYEHARIPFAKYRKKFLDPGATGLIAGVPDWVTKTTDPSVLIPVPFIDNFIIMVAGGPGEKNMIVPCWTNASAVTRPVVLPKEWAQLVDSGN